MCNTLIGAFCDTNTNWETLLSSPPYNLKIKFDGKYVIFSYNQIESDFSLPIVQEARGIIFEVGKWEFPVCRAFDKFFNYGEPNAAKIDWNTAHVTEKCDGSLMKVWYDDFTWHVSTNGNVDAFKSDLHSVVAETFGDLFFKYFSDREVSFKSFTDYLDQNNTYLFEMVSPYNRVVIPYDTLQLYYLGYRNNKHSDKVVPFHTETPEFMDYFYIKVPRVFNLFTIDDCIRASSDLPWDEEGYVVDDSDGKRVKIKSPSYVMAHYARTSKQITPERLMEIILQNECDEFLVYAEEFTDALKQLQTEMDIFIMNHKNILTALQEFKDTHGDVDRKTFAEWVKSQPSYLQPYLFLNFDKTTDFDTYTSAWTPKKWMSNIENMKGLNNNAGHTNL